MTEARCDNCNRRQFPGDLNPDGVCPDCAQFSRETEQEPRRQIERAATRGVL